MDYLKLLHSKRHEFGKMLLYSIMGIVGYWIILSLYLPTIGYKTLVPIELLICVFLVVGYIGYMLSKTRFEFKTIYAILATSMMILVFIFSLFIYQASFIIYLYYVPLVMLVLMVTNIKKAVITAIFLLALCYFTPQISSWLGIETIRHHSVTDLFINKIQDYSIIFFVIYFSFLILFYNSQFLKLQTNIDILGENTSKDSVVDEQFELKYELSKEKAAELHDRIIDYFTNEQPFKNPDFNMAMMAKDLNTNTNYLSRALSVAFGKNFRDLINEHRVNYVVEKFNESAHKKFTIEHLYFEAGFEQQSTFNRVFKKHTGFTPSQYIEMLEK